MYEYPIESKIHFTSRARGGESILVDDALILTGLVLIFVEFASILIVFVSILAVPAVEF